MNSFILKLVTLLGIVIALMTISSARSEQIYGLSDDGELFSFDSATPGTVSGEVNVTGVTSGQLLVGIDFRPATGQLYALSYESTFGASQLYVIDPLSGVATTVGSGFNLNTGSGSMGFDFNPSVDRIRVVFESGDNYRLNPIDGTLAGTDSEIAYAMGDVNFGDDAAIVGAAYTNNVAGGTPTTLYGYDFLNDRLVTIGGINSSPSPNGGQLFTIGSTGINTSSASIGFDISGSTSLAYVNADVVGGGGVDNLYTVNLGNGALTLVGPIGGELAVLDLAVVPEPTTFALLGVAALVGGVLMRRRKSL